MGSRGKIGGQGREGRLLRAAARHGLSVTLQLLPVWLIRGLRIKGGGKYTVQQAGGGRCGADEVERGSC